ncbi:MAG: hypothetical protein V4582_14645 [Pseudomonadota bacterium]
MDRDKNARATASQYFVAGELCRRGYTAMVTLGNTPNTDILCSNQAGTRFVHIQVKSFVPGTRSCSVGSKAEREFGAGYFWVLAGIPAPGIEHPFQFFVIPSHDMAANLKALHMGWLAMPGKDGLPHHDNTLRAVSIPPHKSRQFWNIDRYQDRWDLIGAALDG